MIHVTNAGSFLGGKLLSSRPSIQPTIGRTLVYFYFENLQEGEEAGRVEVAAAAAEGGVAEAAAAAVGVVVEVLQHHLCVSMEWSGVVALISDYSSSEGCALVLIN